MDDALKAYLQSIKKSTAAYKEKKLKTKEYLQSMRDIQKWLEEKCDEYSRN